MAIFATEGKKKTMVSKIADIIESLGEYYSGLRKKRNEEFGIEMLYKDVLGGTTIFYKGGMSYYAPGDELPFSDLGEDDD